VSSITLIDFKLIHVDFVEFVIRTLAPNMQLTIHRLEDSETFPALGKEEYNVLYGKDIFEHLFAPEARVKKMLESAQRQCRCYFDFADHGERVGQHVTPNITYLTEVVESYEFVRNGTVGKLTEFIRE
jgi:hypothetical protein